MPREAAPPSTAPAYVMVACWAARPVPSPGGGVDGLGDSVVGAGAGVGEEAAAGLVWSAAALSRSRPRVRLTFAPYRRPATARPAPRVMSGALNFMVTPTGWSHRCGCFVN